MGCCCSKPVDDPVAGTPSKGEAQQEAQRETQGEIQGETPSNQNRARDTVISLLSFASIISEAWDLLKPMKVVAEFIKKILEVTKVSFTWPEENSLFTNPKERAGGRR